MLPLLLGLSIAILASVVLSACIGVAGSSLSAVWESLTNFDPNSTVHQVIRELRLPRAVGAVLIGAALALSGAIMQGIGNNIIVMDQGRIAAQGTHSELMNTSPLYQLMWETYTQSSQWNVRKGNTTVPERSEIEC